MAKIGIRLADGKFYPILEDGQPVKKRLVVTTVKDDQASVQIDVYRKAEELVEENAYIGSLIIENIPPGPKGRPDIRLDLGLDDEGNLNAYALEVATGEHQTLTVSLKALAEEEKYEIPDFDFQDDEAISGTDYDTAGSAGDDSPFDFDIPEDAGAGTVEHSSIPFSFEEETPEEETGEKKKASPLLIGLLAAVAVIILFGLAYMIFQVTADRVPAPPTTPTTIQTPSAPAPVVAPAPAPAAAATPAPAPTKAAPVASPPASPPPTASTAKAPGVWYKVRWGDTLWDLSIAYYRTPWLYGNIAKANKLANPDLIISGTWIYIPPR